MGESILKHDGCTIVMPEVPECVGSVAAHTQVAAQITISLPRPCTSGIESQGEPKLPPSAVSVSQLVQGGCFRSDVTLSLRRLDQALLRRDKVLRLVPHLEVMRETRNQFHNCPIELRMPCLGNHFHER